MTTMNAVRVPRLPIGVQFDSGNEQLAARIQQCLDHPLGASFLDSVERLVAMATNIGGSARLYWDFAPLSFGWAVTRADGSCWMAGGLIFHGAHDGGGNGGAPTYSVNVQPIEGWAPHS